MNKILLISVSLLIFIIGIGCAAAADLDSGIDDSASGSDAPALGVKPKILSDVSAVSSDAPALGVKPKILSDAPAVGTLGYGYNYPPGYYVTPGSPGKHLW